MGVWTLLSFVKDTCFVNLEGFFLPSGDNVNFLEDTLNGAGVSVLYFFQIREEFKT